MFDRVHLPLPTVPQSPPRPMTKLVPFLEGLMRSVEIKRFTTEVNRLVDRYNITPDATEKERLLREIQDQMKAVGDNSLPSQIAGSLDYRKAQAALFTEIKYQLASLGHGLLRSEERASPVSELIANMAPDKADALMAILVKAPREEMTDEIRNLYREDDTSEEAVRCREFSSTHRVLLLSGGNSKNYVVYNPSDDSSAILKLEDRLDTSRSAEAILRSSVTGCFTPIAAERFTTCLKPGSREHITRTLLVTEYCLGGSLHYDSKPKSALSPPTLEQRADRACDRLRKMAGAMLELQGAGYIFPDAKITNWLVNGEGHLRIADTKSILRTKGNGDYSSGLPGYDRGKLFCTEDFIPPEFASSFQTINADKTHAYLLGKNLYLYLIQSDSVTGDNGADFDFSAPIFGTAKGQEMRSLIGDLVKPNPADRMSVQKAIVKLFLIDHPEFKKTFDDLNALRFGSQDREMDKFIQARIKEIEVASPRQKAQILSWLNNTVEMLKADREVAVVRRTISGFRDSAGLFTVGMTAKADRIETAMSSVPVQHRANFLRSGACLEVQKALASPGVPISNKVEQEAQRVQFTFAQIKQRLQAECRAPTSPVGDPEVVVTPRAGTP